MGNSSKEYMRAYRKANREKLNTQLKEWRSTRMEKVRADNRAWYEANKEKIEDSVIELLTKLGQKLTKIN